MKSMYEKISDALQRMKDQEDRDRELWRQVKNACRVTQDGTWTVTDDSVELPDRTACRYAVKSGKIIVQTAAGEKLGEFDDVGKATDCMADEIAKGLRAYEEDQAAQLETKNWRRPTSKPLYPA